MKAIIIAFTALFLLSNVSAFAVSSAYYSTNPLKLPQGETQDFMLVLQNPSGPETEQLKVNILSGADILEITDKSDIYSIPIGEKTSVNLRAVIPQDAKIGQIYPVNLELITMQESSKGEFGFGSAIGQSFDIVVTRTDGTTTLISKSTMKLLIILGIGIFVLGLIAILVVKKRKR
ncbi:MAG: hypothetical protein Q7S06_00200 [Nanoarchaeota archaeon]|nr:hypothetical protein [Nanoarchaeota archaeon]